MWTLPYAGGGTLPPRLLTLTAAVSAPALLALAALALAGWLHPMAAALAAAGSVSAAAALAWAAERRLAAAARKALAETARLTRDWRRQLEAARAAHEAIFANLPVPLLLVERGRLLTRVNRAAEALLGEGIAGRQLVAVLRHPLLLEAVDAVLAGGAGRAVEFALPVPVERHLAARVEPLPAATAEGTAVLVALHDLTSVAQAERMRVDFIANVSHELRTPLSALVGFIETLAGPARDDAEARQRFLAIMAAQAARMARLVGDLLSLSRIELNEHSPPTGTVELGSLLRAVADGLQVKAGEKGMRIELNAPTPSGGPGPLDALPAITGDADELTQVFQNLIDNAIKYAGPGTAVRVAGWSPAPGQVAVAVMDEGEGIGRQHLPRLTERFYRVDTARSRDLGGTGLGLAIVKHVVSRHRGRLEIESVAGKGSTFKVLLPTRQTDTRP